MSQALFNARKHLAQTSTLLKQGQLLSAVRGAYAGVRQVANSKPTRSEMEEYNRLIEDACYAISNNQEIKKLFPLRIEYKPGFEAALAETLAELADTLESHATSQLPADALRIIAEKEEGLDKGQQELEQGAIDAARSTFSTLVTTYSDDAVLSENVGEKFMQSGLYEDASKYFEASLTTQQSSPRVFNRLGIALRKIKRYEASEENFKKAIAIDGSDPNLYFNLGRLYFDWKHWPECLAQAEKALELNAGFTEAKQLADYVRKLPQ